MGLCPGLMICDPESRPAESPRGGSVMVREIGGRERERASERDQESETERKERERVTILAQVRPDIEANCRGLRDSFGPVPSLPDAGSASAVGRLRPSTKNFSDLSITCPCNPDGGLPSRPIR